ncbi:cell surface glycoprotein 1-like [Xenia sp. Carnegie-2017]|uniref:cell surface glycoprotein 1-like n=1 Tax=Xenia sp. Carnegie-2017 TaxID=2897299 RepID=UPI001F04021E|nr:cell surface glycoprotein 1-like [Xenia sp. Carnegie-2017]
MAKRHIHHTPLDPLAAPFTPSSPPTQPSVPSPPQLSFSSPGWFPASQDDRLSLHGGSSPEHPRDTPDIVHQPPPLAPSHSMGPIPPPSKLIPPQRFTTQQGTTSTSDSPNTLDRLSISPGSTPDPSLLPLDSPLTTCRTNSPFTPVLPSQFTISGQTPPLISPSTPDNAQGLDHHISQSSTAATLSPPPTPPPPSPQSTRHDIIDSIHTQLSRLRQLTREDSVSPSPPSPSSSSSPSSVSEPSSTDMQPAITAFSRLLEMSERPKPSSSSSSTVTEDRASVRVAPPPPVSQQTQPFHRRNRHSSSSKVPQLTPILQAYRHQQGGAAHRPQHPPPQHHAEQSLAASDHADWDSADDFASPSLHPRPVSRHSDTPSHSPPPQHTPGLTDQVDETINEIPSHQPRPHREPDHLPPGEGNHNAPPSDDEDGVKSGRELSLKTLPGRNSPHTAPPSPLPHENWPPA